jgi:iron(III) transport system substrate-binding protein
LLAACGGTRAASPAAQAPAAGSSAEKVCAAGKTEGKVVIWTSVELEAWQKEVKPFTKLYPDIKLTHVLVDSRDAARRILTNASVGKSSEGDIIEGEREVFTPLLDQGAMNTSFDWTKLGYKQDQVLNESIVRHYIQYGGLGYNTELVKESELPNTWEELVDPKWRGQLTASSRGIQLREIGLAWGSEKLYDYARRLKDTVKPLIIDDRTSSLLAVASGQVKLSIAARDAEVAEQQSKGAPVGIKYLDYVSTDQGWWGIPKAAPHPNAAACLIAWLATPEARDLQYKVEFKRNVDDPPTLAGNAVLVGVTNEEESAKVEKNRAELAKIFVSG